MKKRVAFVAPRCGDEVNGGAERHCYLVAERLADHWDVEVLTTCAIDYQEWRNAYEPGLEQVGKVPIRRFPVDQEREPASFNKLSREIHGRRVGVAKEEAWMRAQGPLSTALLDHIKQVRDDFDAFIFFPYLYATTYFALPLVKEKAFLAPLAHDEWMIHLEMWDRFFELPAAFIFNTPAERAFLARRFPKVDLKGPVVGVGIEPPKEMDAARFRRETGIEDPFLLYIGRIDPSKGCDRLFEHFLAAAARGLDKRKLVLIGKAAMTIPEHEGIVPLGFVSEQTKWDALAACDLLVNPSPFESLSMVLQEAWLAGKPAMVNGSCEVLVSQCERAQGGLWYNDFAEFRAVLETLTPDVAKRLGARGKAFVSHTYAWPTVIKAYQNMFQYL